MTALLLVFELLLLYFLSRWVTQAIYTFFLLLFRARSVAVSLVLVLEFPGTVIHELAHLFTAEVLGVRTGKLKLEPESIRSDDITSGSVMIAQSDPFRRYMIGLAPLTWGMVTLTAIAYFIPDMGNWPYWGYIGIGYLLFAVSNTMFPSPQDMKGFWPFGIVIGIIFGAFYVFGIRIVLTGQILEMTTRIFTTLTRSLGIVVIINTAILLFTKSMTALMYRFSTT